MSNDESTLYCRVVDLDQEVTGEILNEELVKGTWTKNLIRYVCNGDCIRGAIVMGKENGKYLFSIRDAYLAYARRRAGEDDRNAVVMEAVVTDVKKDWYEGRVIWMTPVGYGGVSFLPAGRDFKPGDKAVMTILNIQKTGSSVFINLCSPRYGYEKIDRPFESDDDVLADFVTTQEEILSSAREEAEDQGTRL